MGAILLLSTDPNVAGEMGLADPLRRSGFQAARHNIYMHDVSIFIKFIQKYFEPFVPPYIFPAFNFITCIDCLALQGMKNYED
jgi:hypothetical protein